MTYYWVVTIVSAASIGIPLVAILFHIRRIGNRYMPFAFYLTIGAANEWLSFYLIRNHQSNIVNSNIYSLLEYGLLLWLFFRVTPQKLSWRLLYVLTGVVIWLLDNFYLHSIRDDNSYFRIFACLTISWLSIEHINLTVFSDRITAYRKTDLLLGIGLFVFFAYSAFLRCFYVVSVGLHISFYMQLWLILSIVNLIANLIFMFAILWIPKHRPIISI